MKFDLQSKDGLTLKTKGKYVKEDIAVGLSESDKSALVPENIVEEASVLGVQGSLKKYDGTFEGEAQAEVNELKKLLDYAKNMSYMFYGNVTFTDLTDYINYNDTENVENMSYTFYWVANLTKLPLMNTSKVKDMSHMCEKCENLIIIPPLDTSNVKKMAYIFSECTKLQSDISLITDNVNSLERAFYSCKKVEKIEISLYNPKSSNDLNYTWCGCNSLKTLIIRNFGQYALPTTSAFLNATHITDTKDGFIYVPRSMVDTLKSATNWSTYADQIRALEDYTVDGTTTGELDESKVNA